MQSHPVGGSPRKRRSASAWQLVKRHSLTVYALLVVGYLMLPIAVVIIFALNPTPYIAFPPVGVTLRWFIKFFSSAEFMNALWLSLRVAVLVVVLSTVIGAMCALAIARGNLPGARLLTTLFLSPLMLPAILTGLALFQVFMLAGNCPAGAQDDTRLEA